MAYKTILVHLNGSESLDARVRLAAGLANRFEAHLTGIAPAGVAQLPGDTYMGFSEGWLEQAQNALDAEAEKAVGRFEEICQQQGVSSVESRTVAGESAEALLAQARVSDLIVIGQAEDSRPAPGSSRSMVEQILLGAGKPVVVVPNIGQYDDPGKRVLFAWDGGRESARAAADAIPLLTRAELVEVVLVNAGAETSTGHPPIAGSEIALFLARHGVNAQVRNLKSDIDVGNTILSHAADVGCDLIVMGAYGHSRIREWVMGGATRTLLNSMTAPVLMSH